MRNLDKLTSSIQKIRRETQNTDQIDVKVVERLLTVSRETLLTELNEVLLGFEISEKFRKVSPSFLYVFAESMVNEVLLNAVQKYMFSIISQGEINLGIRGITEIDKTHETAIRLTYYPTFLERYEKMCEAIKMGELDEYTNLSASQLIYEIMGKTGKLVPYLDKK